MKAKWSIVVMLFLICIPLQVSAKQLIPMGHSIGVQLEMPYVYVSHDVLLESGEWLKQGERITEINGKTIANLEQLFDNEQAQITVENAQNSRKLEVSKQQLQRLRPFVKNATDGVGTLTYIDPSTLEYGALGHQIIDSVLKQPPTFNNGAIFEASISQVKKSIPGQPGYKVSVVDKATTPLGTVNSNELYGIFGRWEQPLQESLHQPLEIMHKGQLKQGTAHLLTAIDGEKIEAFDIEIDEISDTTFTFQVSDKRLIRETGGIIQGMSGSPIIQNNQFVGAITHMFVEEPTKGAGILVIEMLKKSPN
ncbi:SpoIVB peptidase S55 domain-containing protein [Solibacillus daqui]|uniref:SpoIVB peptidase S55 domain-containing protein n=1 Tax=Solibacillus daqui TaxID=2912187 RepID=UPI0023652444|nr:SpoIVB peptidase S55 domain-containing protein [Solibacillus daqui]